MLPGIVVTIFQCWESTLLFDAFMSRCVHKSKFYLYIILIGLGLGISLNLVFSSSLVLCAIASVVAFFLINSLLYQDVWYNRLLIVLGWYALLISTEGTLSSLLFFVFRKNAEVLSSAAFVFFIAVCEFIVLYLFARFVQYINKANKRDDSEKRWYFLISMLYILAICFSLLLALLILNNINISTSLASTCISFVVVCSILFVKKTQHIEQTQKEKLALDKKLKSEAEGIEILSAAYAQQRKMTHDYNEHLNTLHVMLQHGNIPQAEFYLQELLQTQTERILYVNTHHAGLDAIFNQKAIIAHKNKIDLQFHFNNLHEVKVLTCDLAVIIGNLMDNAIEACLDLPVEKRYIEVHAILDENFIFSIRNRSLPVCIADGHINTTKPNPELHGFGLRNVDSILSYYPNAFHNLEYEDGWFFYTLEIPNTLRSLH